MKTFEQIGVESGVLNYIDLETPRRYFVHASVEYEDIQDFATNIVNEVFKELDKADVQYSYKVQEIILHKMGL